MPPLNIGDGRNLSALTAREWLLTDGRGGYALGTHAGLNTRKYHGLLIVSRPPPTGRLLLLSRLEETLVADGARLGLDTGCYEPGVLHPEGYRQLVDFVREPTPTWRFRALGRELRRRVAIDREAGGVVVTWELLAGDPCELEVRPLLTRRSHHAVARVGDLQPECEFEGATLRWRARAGEPATVVSVDGEIADRTPHWYRDALHGMEKERGYECVEDLHAPALFKLKLKVGEPATLRAAADDEPAPPAPPPPAARPARRPKDEVCAAARDALVRAADAFLIRGTTGAPGVVAGYPWFEEWARDTMIALPGLLLSTGRTALATEMLSAWAARLRDGLLPNRLGDKHDVDDNSADAPLLFVRAVEALDRSVRDRAKVERKFFAPVNEILDRFHRGTRHGIGVDHDGLLRAGEPGQALTWMDAVVNGEAITPRRGKPIELNALYGEALRFGAELADRNDDAELGALYRERGEVLASAMRDRFLDAKGWLRDVVDISGPGDGDAFRPNLLFALAAKSSPFTVEEAERNLARVAVDLVTPFGLRTLAPAHPQYAPRYAGDQTRRDRAYHQGTVWPWLVGVYADAVFNVRGRTPAARETVEAALTPLLKFVVDHGSLPEVFDGDRPHEAGGCPAQAWSVSEVLRALDLVT